MRIRAQVIASVPQELRTIAPLAPLPAEHVPAKSLTSNIVSFKPTAAAGSAGPIDEQGGIQALLAPLKVGGRACPSLM